MNQDQPARLVLKVADAEDVETTRGSMHGKILAFFLSRVHPTFCRLPHLSYQIKMKHGALSPLAELASVHKSPVPI
jgi:hypothetical protein